MSLRMCLSLGVTLLTLTIPLRAGPPATPAPSAQDVELFEKHVRPVLVEQCQSCHGASKQKMGLRLDSRAGLLKGGDAGAVVVPGQPEKSPLIQAIRYTGDTKMPPKGKLPPAAIQALTLWVQRGAPWPETTVAAGTKSGLDAVAEARQSHWAFRPVEMPLLPAVKNAAWVQTPVDRFVLARLEAEGLAPAPPADKRTLLRRVTFDLTGLPPTPEEVVAFEADSSPEAFARVVDRLLASPAYGERWGRHWLDVARYADSKGYVFTEERRFPYAYTYRDYVVRAFNDDLPYDQFILQQLAADALPLGADKRPLAAMGFLTLGRRFLNNAPDIIDDRIDVVCRGLLGLTVGCARCHDHKFDPIPQKDYYSLYGVFASSVEPNDLPLLEAPARTAAYDAFVKELQARERKMAEFLAERHADLLPRYRASATDYWLLPDGPRAPAAGDLNRAMLRRWQMYLAETRKVHDPVLAAWQAFAALPPEEFAMRAPSLARKLAANDDPAARLNPLVARAFAGPPPASLRDVAQRYAALLAGADKLWQETLRSAQEQKKAPPQALADADQEALRQVLYGAKSPTNVPLAETDRILDRKDRDKLTALRRQVENWKATSPAAPPRAMVLQDLPTPQTPHVFLRGNPNNPGEAVPRQFLLVLSGRERKPFAHGSGRLDLARAIASKDNPLTARVLVNRVWLHHFGAGLVRTPSDFGLRGEPPTHPELLDYLAATFQANGWSLKQLHRTILLSATYQQSSEGSGDVYLKDPENRLLSRMNRRRLDFEELRDALLAVSGRLDRTAGGPAVELTTAPFTPRRTLYGFIDRQNLPGLFRTFDFASPDTSSPQRYTTTVPQQALFLMNSPFVVAQARKLAARSDVAVHMEPEKRIERLYRLLYGRAPEPEEITLGLHFLEAAGQDGGGPRTRTGPSLSPWEKYAQVLLLANEFAFVD